jgi:hypothetical protein
MQVMIDTKKVLWEMHIVTEMIRYDDFGVHPSIELCNKYLSESNLLRK